MTAHNGKNWKGVSAVECDQRTSLRGKVFLSFSSPAHQTTLEIVETLKAVGPFYLVSMPGEVKGGKCVTCRGLHILT